MVNDNILRPSILGQAAGTSSAASAESNPMINPNASPELTAIITNIVTQVLQGSGRQVIQDIVHPNDPLLNAVDQGIDPQHAANLDALDKVPDIVRSLREFSGNPGEFSSWKKSVERILGIYERQKGTPRYFGILNVIRNKIVGSADVALESYNTPLDWKAISRCLTLHYADKRDLTTLEYQMTTLMQGDSTVENFYQQVYNHLSLILNKLSCMDIGMEALQLMTQTYRDKALDTFVRGLKGDLSRLLGVKEPTDLPQALHLCLKLQNQNFRTSHALHASVGNKRFNPNSLPPNLPPRNRDNHNFANKNRDNYRENQGRNPFFPQIAYMPQTQPRQFNNFNKFNHQQFQVRSPNQGFLLVLLLSI